MKFSYWDWEIFLALFGMREILSILRLIIFMASDHAEEDLLDTVYFPLAVAV